MTIHHQIYNRLIEIARFGDITTYSEIAPLAGRNMESKVECNKISEILGEISTYEHEHGRPMLSAIVVHADDRTPGNGFFNLTRELRLPHKLDDLVELEFLVKEVEKVHRYWGSG